MPGVIRTNQSCILQLCLLGIIILLFLCFICSAAAEEVQFAYSRQYDLNSGSYDILISICNDTSHTINTADLEFQIQFISPDGESRDESFSPCSDYETYPEPVLLLPGDEYFTRAYNVFQRGEEIKDIHLYYNPTPEKYNSYLLLEVDTGLDWTDKSHECFFQYKNPFYSYQYSFDLLIALFNQTGELLYTSMERFVDFGSPVVGPMGTLWMQWTPSVSVDGTMDAYLENVKDDVSSARVFEMIDLYMLEDQYEFQSLDDNTAAITSYIGESISNAILLPVVDRYLVRSIESNAFQNSDIRRLTIMDTVETLKDHAFNQAYFLEQVYIPDSVTDIQGNPFVRCKSLTTFDFSSSYGNGIYVFSDGLLLDQWDQILICYPSSRRDQILTIPNGIQEIGRSAFEGVEFLTTVFLPEGLTRIQSNAFDDCINLRSVSLPESLETIDDQAFKDCVSLTHLTIPYSVYQISEDAFIGCNKLVVSAEEGSYARQYCRANRIPLEGEEPTEEPSPSETPTKIDESTDIPSSQETEGSVLSDDTNPTAPAITEEPFPDWLLDDE